MSDRLPTLPFEGLRSWLRRRRPSAAKDLAQSALLTVALAWKRHGEPLLEDGAGLWDSKPFLESASGLSLEILMFQSRSKARSKAQTVLLMGVRHQSPTWAQWGIDAGADPNFLDLELSVPLTPTEIATEHVLSLGWQRNPFHIRDRVVEAHQQDRAVDLLRVLLRAGGDPNRFVSGEDRKRTAFSAVCRGGFPQALRCMLTDSRTPVDLLVLDDQGRTAALCAVENLNLANLKFPSLQALQDHFERQFWSAHPDWPRNHLWTSANAPGVNALHAAMNITLADWSLCFDPPISEGVHPRHCLLQWLIHHPDLGMKEEIERRDGDGNTVLMRAVGMQLPWEVRFFLSLGASPHAINDDGLTPLMIAQQNADRSSDARPILDDLLAHQATEAAAQAIDRVLQGITATA